MSSGSRSAESGSVALGFSIPVRKEDTREPDVISLEALLAGPSRKRARVTVEDVLDDSGPELRSVPEPKKRRAKGERLLKALREIIGREGLGPIDYKHLAQRIQVPMNLLDLLN